MLHDVIQKTREKTNQSNRDRACLTMLEQKIQKWCREKCCASTSPPGGVVLVEMTVLSHYSLIRNAVQIQSKQKFQCTATGTVGIRDSG